MASDPTPRVPRRKRVLDAVRSQIIQLRLLPGAPISENDLAAALGVSRTPVREALLLLAEEGLVEVFPKIGSFVTRVDSDQVAEAQFLREAVELASLRSIEIPLDPDLVTQLEDNLRQQEDVLEDLAGFFELDEAFHRGLMALAGHEASWSRVSAAKGHLDRARMLGITQRPTLARFLDQHRAVFDAVRSGAIDRAEELLRTHLRVVFSDIQEVQRRSPELFATDPAARPSRRAEFVWK